MHTFCSHCGHVSPISPALNGFLMGLVWQHLQNGCQLSLSDDRWITSHNRFVRFCHTGRNQNEPIAWHAYQAYTSVTYWMLLLCAPQDAPDLLTCFVSKCAFGWCARALIFHVECLMCFRKGLQCKQPICSSYRPSSLVKAVSVLKKKKKKKKKKRKRNARLIKTIAYSFIKILIFSIQFFCQALLLCLPVEVCDIPKWGSVYTLSGE